MYKGTIYLSGPMTHGTYDAATGWREDTRGLFGPDYCVLSPVRGKEFLDNGKPITDSYDQPSHPFSTQKGIITRDYNDCVRCDVMLVNLAMQRDRVSIGTVMEMAWAYAHRTPVVMVGSARPNIHDHAMVREVAGYTVETVYEAVQICKLVIG